MAGAGISGYLTLAHLRAVELGCSKIHGCEEVAQHWSAKGFGIPALQAIPTAAFGILMYLALLALAFMRAAADSVERDRKLANLQWLISASGVAVTAWLTYMEAFVIHAWCQWCLASAFIVVLIFLTATAERMMATPPNPPIETQGEPV